MKLIPRHLRPDYYSFCSQKSVGDLKTDLQTLFDNNWYDFSVNLTGDFTSDNDFQITKKISASFSKSGSSGSTSLKCKVYADTDKTVVDIIVKPNPQLYVWTIVPLLFALLMLYSIVRHSTNDLTVAIVIIVILLLIPFAARFYGQATKTELKDTFVETFKLTKI